MAGRNVVLVACCLLLAGCMSGGMTLERGFKMHATALVEGDVDGFARFYGDSWIDFGGCVEHDETPAVWFADWVASGEHAQEFEGWSVETAFIWSEMEIETVSDATWGIGCDLYEPQDGDMTAWVSPADGSPMFDGFYGLYRNVGGQWIQLGGD